MDITSFVLGYKKGKAEGGGALTEPVCHVTFMNGDTVLYEKPVFVGDDCTDIVKKGTIGTPSKASTPQYSYTYTGWSLTNGGEASTSALAAVSEDRTVYAAFKSVVRVYTVTYLDDNGSVLKTESLAYGVMPSYTPSKEGFSFDEWEPALATVTGDVTYMAKWIEKVTFAGGAWADIARISEAGEAAEYFKVGDTKTITVGGNTIELLLIGFDHDDLADGSGKAGMTVVAKTALADTMPVSDWSTLASDMKSKLKPQLPVELQSIIKPVIKQCDVTGTTGTDPIDVTFELFPLSFKECKIQGFWSKKYTDTDWVDCFTPLGETYQYFEEQYSTSWYGPYATFLHENGDRWYRQWYTKSSNKYGLYNKVSLSSKSYGWAENVDPNSLHKVIMAFCI